MSSSTEFYQSQIGDSSVINYSYTDSPLKLLFWDTYYFFVYGWTLPWLVLPIGPWPSGDLDETYPSRKNMYCILMHVFLAVLQLTFILSFPLAIFLPLWMSFSIASAFLVVNWTLCKGLNGTSTTFRSEKKYARALPEHAHEQWVFLNGVAVGEHWMMNNLNRLAMTFGRPILGIHNKTSGIVFDVIECLIQRNLTLATQDVRTCFKLLRDVLYDPSKSKVIFILHSQGAIEGGLVLDWLLQEMPQDVLAKLEVYTFGNAANHFNNPHRHEASQELLRSSDAAAALTTFYSESTHSLPPPRGLEQVSQNAHFARHSTAALGTQHVSANKPPPPRTVFASEDRVIAHIEHYAHSTDFVAMWGVLHFATHRMGSPALPRFLGRLFNRTSSGHQLNQHYLNDMFPLKRDAKTGEFVGADENNEFMEEIVRVGHDSYIGMNAREAIGVSLSGTQGSGTYDIASYPTDASGNKQDNRAVKVKDLSRLWAYRNGRSPAEPSALIAAQAVPAHKRVI